MGHKLTDFASIPLFAGLRRDEIALIIGAASSRSVKSSEIVIGTDEPATRLVVVTGGHVDYFIPTSHGEEILLKRMLPGDVFGVASFISTPLRYLGTARSSPHGEILEWQRRAVLQLAKTFPRFPENAFRITLEYVSLCARRHAELLSNTAAQRLAIAITALASRAGRVLPSGVEVEIKNEELASLADTSSFTASRVLKRWEREKSVQKSRGRILIRRPEKLLS
jgi:CRP-like cAMP-binding protein